MISKKQDTPQSEEETFHEKACRIFGKAIKEAQERNRRLGIPNVYGCNGKLFYELPNGEITSKRPDSLNRLDEIRHTDEKPSETSSQ